MFNISKLDSVKRRQIKSIIDQKTKPLGALGLLEEVAEQLV